VSTERAKAELGWKQEIPLEQSLADTMHAIRALRRLEGHSLPRRPLTGQR
jgi:nucleoside-diphosphate-sugar epimerase